MKFNLKKIISFGLAAVFVTASAICMHVPAAAKQENIVPYQTDAVGIYEGDPKEYFTMMGINYTYGVQFAHGNSNTECSFNLGGVYDLVTFDLGHIDGGSGGTNPVMKIYYDGEYKEEIALDVNMMTNHISLNVSGVDQLRFCLEAKYGHNYGMANVTAYTYDAAAAAGETIPALMSSKLVYNSNLKPGYILPYQTDAVGIYEGDPEEYFTMMGINYTYGVQFAHGNSNAGCSFNLGGMYDLVTFDLGHIDGGSGGTNPVLKIYYDGEYKEEIALDVNMITNHISLNVSGVDQLRFRLEAKYGHNYGMANVTAYTYDAAAAAGETIPALISSKLVYKSNLKPGYISPYQTDAVGIYEGDPEEYFIMMGVNYTYGVQFAHGTSNTGCCFNLGGMYDLVTFDLGHIDGGSKGTNPVLKIYYDGEYKKEIALSGSMATEHISLNVSGVDQLRFRLEAKYGHNYGMANVTGVHYHTWAEEKTVGVQPTCVVAGEKAIYCLTCGEADPATVEAVPALGHDYVNEVCTRCGNRAVHKHKWAAEKTVSVEPTCILAGEKAIYCLTCGEADPATIEVIPALGHNYVDNVCTRCGKPEKVIPSGDVNNDGVTNSKDLTRLMKVVAGEMIDAVGGDINGDGVVNSKDLTRLMKFIAGAISELA